MTGTTARGADIGGFAEPRFRAVEEAFRSNFERGLEVGAGVCIYEHGRPVVDLWGGIADPASGRRWEEDTMAVVFSTNKGVCASAIALLVDRGQLSLDEPVATYWPEFAAAGKGTIPLRWLCAHKAGLSAPEAPITTDDLAADRVASRLAAQAPEWEPGTAHGYHAWTIGWLLSEVVRRVTGHSMGQLVAEDLAGPMGLNLFIGLPAELEDRVARLEWGNWVSDPDDTPVPELLAALVDPESLPYRSGNAFDMPATDDPSVHRLEIPAGGGFADARSLARLYASLIGEVDGQRLISPATTSLATQPEAEGRDLVMLCETRFSSLGFSLPGGPIWPPRGSDQVFGHPGAGGSEAFADAEAGLAFGYVMNNCLGETAALDRVDRLIDAMYRSAAG